MGYFDRLLTSPRTLDTFLMAVEKFTQAEEDYLCELGLLMWLVRCSIVGQRRTYSTAM